MYYHGITLREGSTISNLVVASGTASFPTSPDEGELFFRADADVTIRGLHCYIGGSWDRIASSDAITAPSGVAFPSVALRGDIYYLKSGAADEGLYFYTGSTWVSTAASFNVTGDVSGTLSGASSTLNLVTIGTAGTTGSASSTPLITIDAKGRVTGLTSTAININGNQVTAGTLADARITQSSVTQHQAALTIAETQITDGALLTRNAGNETITGTWTFNNPVSGAAPTAGTHLVTKDYADTLAAGFTWKRAVRVATTDNIALNSLQTIDGFALSAGDRVLVKAQNNSAENGIYVADSGLWPRASDMDSVSPIDEVNGAAVFVRDGATLADTGWIQTASVAVIGLNPMVWVQFSSQGAYQAGAGLTLTSNVFSLTPLANSNTGTFLKLSRDAYGRLDGTTPVTTSDIRSLVNSVYVTKVGDIMSGDLTIAKTNPRFYVNASDAQQAGLGVQVGAQNRWFIGRAAGSETGANAASNFAIDRYDDAGALLGTALAIERASGNASFSSTVTAPTFVGSLTGAASLNVLKAGDTMTGNLTLSRTDPTIFLAASASGQVSRIVLSTGGVNRWLIDKTAEAEIGANNGSNFALSRYSDTGALLSTALSINRASGNATFSGTVTAPSFNGSVTGASSLNVLKTGDTMSGTLDLGGNKALSSATPTSSVDLTNKSYVDSSDYLNEYPKVGLYVGDSRVPVYSDFKFGLGTWGAGSFTMVDRDSRQVFFFVASTPVNQTSVFRAYRSSDTDTIVFDNDKVSLTFLNAGEYVANMNNLGTYFAVLTLGSTTAPWAHTRTVIVKTGGSSRWQDWTFAYDVSSLHATHDTTGVCFSLVSRAGDPDRILRTYYDSGARTTILAVFDSSLTLLRSQSVFIDASDVDYSNSNGWTGASISFSYTPSGMGNGFTWNPFTETFHQKCAGYYNRGSSSGVVGIGYSLSLSWKVPRAWILTGAAPAPTNLIPVKNGAYRYNAYTDATWDTETGGISTTYGASGNAYCMITDEYSGNMYFVIKSTFSNLDGGYFYRLNYSSGKQYLTIGGSYLTSFITNTAFVQLPDSSAWAKNFSGAWTSIVGTNNIQFVGYSNQYGSQLVNTTFSTSQFNSTTIANNTLKLDAAGAVLSPQNSWPTAVQQGINTSGFFGTIVTSGTPTVYYCSPGRVIHRATASGSTRTWTPVAPAITVPAIPSTIGAVSNLVSQDMIAWNGSTLSPGYWAVVKENGQAIHIARYTNGVWSLPIQNVAASSIANGNAARGDSAYTARIYSNHLLTESRLWLWSMDIPYVGGDEQLCITINTANNTAQVDSWSKFNPATAGQVGNYGATGGYNGTSYGYSTLLGYFVARLTSNYVAMCLLSSKDILGVGAAKTESDWYNNTSGRYETWLSVESSTGLVAYLSPYPIFLGGYYTSIPSSSVGLVSNATNYIYATKDPADRTTVNISTSTTLMPNSFSRMLIAAVVTNATSIVSQTSYSFDGIGLPAQTGKANYSLKTDGDTTYWGDNDLLYVKKSGDTMTGSLYINKNAAPLLTYPDTVLQLSQADSTRSRIMLETRNELAGLTFRKANGTYAAPTAVLNGDALGFINHHSYDGTNYIAGAALNFLATEDHSSAGHGVSFTITTIGNAGAGSNVATFSYDGITTQRGNIVSGGGVRAAQGAPNNSDNSTNGFSFGQDGDTGMFSLGVGPGGTGDTVSFYVNNIEGGRLMTNGNWAFGATANSQGRFGVSGSAGNTSNVDLVLTSDATYAYIQSYNSKPLRINPQGNNVLIDSVAKLGIGTLTPNALLSLGPAVGVKALMYDNGAGNAAHGLGIDMTGTGNQLNIFAGTGNAAGASISFGAYNSTNGAYTERMKISDAGITDAAGRELGWKSIPPSTTGFVLGGCYVVTANTNISSSQAGLTFSIYNNSAVSITLTYSAGVTLRLGGTTAVGNRTLLPYGFATLWFADANTCVVNGNVT